MARQRGSNFSTSEKMLLTEMQEFEVIIEDKRTSGGVVIGRGAPLTFRGCRADYCRITILRL